MALVPHWDPYLMAHADRWLWLDPAWAAKVVAASGDSTNVLLVDGEVAGVWDFSNGTLRFARFTDRPEPIDVQAAAQRFAGVAGHLRVVEQRVPPDLGKRGTIQAPFGRAANI